MKTHTPDHKTLATSTRINAFFGMAMGAVLALGLSWSGIARADHHTDLSGKKAAVLIGEGFHDAETFFPIAHLVNLGAEVTIIGVSPGTVKAYNSDMTANVQKSVTDVSPDDFDALIIPGGRSPAALREHESVVDFVRAFVQTGKPSAAICHGPQVMVTAGVLEGRTVTAVAPVEAEITAAGATFEDAPLRVDGNVITSRVPGDLHVFVKAISEAMAK